MLGTVKFFNTAKGFGFIRTEQGTEVYFNRAALPLDRRYDPMEGDAVQFEVRDARQGPIAHHIEQCE